MSGSKEMLAAMQLGFEINYSFLFGETIFKAHSSFPTAMSGMSPKRGWEMLLWRETRKNVSVDITIHWQQVAEVVL